MQTFNEGTIQFAFPAAWYVLKYDDCRYYRGPVARTGAGLAAVDFIAVLPMPRPALLLLEVKDFRGHSTENRDRLTSGDLATEIVKKALDTFGALHAGLRANHAELRVLASALLPYPVQVYIVLLLEEDTPPQSGASGHLSTTNKWKLDTYLKRRGDLLASLAGKLKPFRMTPALYSSTDVPANAGWTATLQR